MEWSTRYKIWISITDILFVYVRWALCHNDMACPQIADGADGIKLCGVAANTLNKEPWTADKGLAFSLGVGRGPNNLLP
jgi:hypothetical protein